MDFAYGQMVVCDSEVKLQGAVLVAAMGVCVLVVCMPAMLEATLADGKLKAVGNAYEDISKRVVVVELHR